jgi:putative ABC transport system permease protein
MEPKTADTTGSFFARLFDEARMFGTGLWVVSASGRSQRVEVAAAIDAEFANSPPRQRRNQKERCFMIAQQIGDIATIVTAILGAVFFTILP